MGFISVLLLGLGLSLDSLAVSLSLGFACGRVTNGKKARYLAVIGIFHFLMIMIGWFFGEKVRGLISAWDHWIAFGLLAFLGGKMITSGLSGKSKENPDCDLFSLRNTLLLGLALSIDALISGFSLGLVKVVLFPAASGCANILLAGAQVGLIAAMVSLTGLHVGQRVSLRAGQRAEVFGGVILILIGLKVLAEHLL